LTVLLLPSQADLAGFLADHEVEIVASLPYFLSQPTDAQRGAGVFDKSVQALRKLNELGYAAPGSGLRLNLTYNPAGAFLPPAQHAIEATSASCTAARHSLQLLFVRQHANRPVPGVPQQAATTSATCGGWSSHNPAAAAGVMCRDTLSVGWDGALHDCDFNQMLGLTTDHGAPTHLAQFSLEELEKRRIVTGPHCYGCTAGAGSGCRGASAS
jgi:radical SAM/Cys-rich protein